MWRLVSSDVRGEQAVLLPRLWEIPSHSSQVLQQHT
jgi:hypothetical protein